MNATAELRLELPDGEAARVAAALEPDNDGFAACRVEGDTLVVAAEAGTALGLLRSLDDVLSCIRALDVP